MCVCVCFFGQASPTVGLLCSILLKILVVLILLNFCVRYFISSNSLVVSPPPPVHIGSVL